MRQQERVGMEDRWKGGGREEGGVRRTYEVCEKDLGFADLDECADTDIDIDTGTDTDTDTDTDISTDTDMNIQVDTQNRYRLLQTQTLT